MGNRRSTKFKAIRIVITLLGLLGLAGAIALGVYSHRLVTTGVRADGRIVTVSVETDARNHRTYTPQFRFTDRKGLEHTVESNEASSYSGIYQVGDRVGVIYFPDGEENARLNEWGAIWSDTAIVAVVGLGLSAAAVLMWIDPKLDRKH